MKRAIAILEQLDVLFSDPDASDEARRVWDVLSALRGPDNSDEILKEQTTAHVRSLAFPCAFSRARDGLPNLSSSSSSSDSEGPLRAYVASAASPNAQQAWDAARAWECSIAGSLSGLTMPLTAQMSSWHFTGHIHSAIRALRQMGRA